MLFYPPFRERREGDPAKQVDRKGDFVNSNPILIRIFI